jgi:hypothetical protein
LFVELYVPGIFSWLTAICTVFDTMARKKKKRKREEEEEEEDDSESEVETRSSKKKRDDDVYVVERIVDGRVRKV